MTNEQILVLVISLTTAISLWRHYKCPKHEFVFTHFEHCYYSETKRPCVAYQAICKHCNKVGKFPGASSYGSFWLVYGCDIKDPLEFSRFLR